MSRGFTLVELLVVIGVLGILITGLLAAIDPFEQLKKGQDTNRKNASVEYHNALIRYYATHGSLPWDDLGAVAACRNLNVSQTGSGTLALDDLSTCTQELIDDGELKEDFEGALSNDAAKMYVTSPTITQVAVCFSPESKSQFADAAVRYDINGSDLSTTTCSSTAKDSLTPGSSCFWCAK